MRPLISILFFSTIFLGAFLAPTRSQAQPFQEVDSFAADFDEDFVDVKILTEHLTAPFDTDVEKARAIFMWIANKLRYDCKKYHNPKPPKFTAYSKEELNKKIADYRKKQVVKAAKYKRGICEDYSLLFKSMCDNAGVESAYILGNARDFYKPYRKAHNNPHAWNAIKIDGRWHLLDVTWASGYTNPEVTKFKRKISPGYFMPEPSWFAQTHFPDEEKWQLLDEPLDRKSFPKQPMINFGQDDYPVVDFAQQAKQGSNDGGGKEIRIKLSNRPKYYMVTTRKGKPIKFTHREENGWDIFQVSSRSLKELVLFGGESQRKQEWLARYDL